MDLFFPLAWMYFADLCSMCWFNIDVFHSPSALEHKSYAVVQLLGWRISAVKLVFVPLWFISVRDTHPRCLGRLTHYSTNVQDPQGGKKHICLLSSDWGWPDLAVSPQHSAPRSSLGSDVTQLCHQGSSVSSPLVSWPASLGLCAFGSEPSPRQALAAPFWWSKLLRSISVLFGSVSSSVDFCFLSAVFLGFSEQLADGLLHSAIYSEGPLFRAHAHPTSALRPLAAGQVRLLRQAIWFPPFSLVILPFIYLFIVLPRTKCCALLHRLIWMIKKSFLFSDRLTQKPWEEERNKES